MVAPPIGADVPGDAAVNAELLGQAPVTYAVVLMPIAHGLDLGVAELGVVVVFADPIAEVIERDDAAHWAGHSGASLPPCLLATRFLTAPQFCNVYSAKITDLPIYTLEKGGVGGKAIEIVEQIMPCHLFLR